MAQVTSWWTRITFRSLHVRLALWALLLLGVTQLLVAGVLLVSLSAWLASQVDNNLLVTAVQVASIVFEEDNPQNPIDPGKIKTLFAEGSLASQTYLKNQLFVVRLVDSSAGRLLETSANFDLPVTAQADRPHYDTYTVSDSSGTFHDLRLYTLPLSYAPGRSLQVGVSLDDIQQTLGTVVRLLVFSLIVTSLLAILSGCFLAGRALIPIGAISRTAAHITATALTQRLDMASAEVELEQLVQTFNAMLDRIEQAFSRQRQFTADAAHELRTPLSIMQTGLDVTLSREREAGDYRATLESIAEEVQRLSQLAHSLLRLALNDAPEFTSVKQAVNLTLLLDSVMDQFDGRAADKKIAVKREIATNLSIMGDEDGLIQVISNLLDNALKFTSEGGSISISATSAPSYVQVIISDTGAGIPPADLPHIFDRFYRVDRARTRQQGGFGLGLAIVKQIVDRHSSSIQVTSACRRSFFCRSGRHF